MVGLIPIQFAVDINSPERVKPNVFDDAMIFPARIIKIYMTNGHEIEIYCLSLVPNLSF